MAEFPGTCLDALDVFHATSEYAEGRVISPALFLVKPSGATPRA